VLGRKQSDWKAVDQVSVGKDDVVGLAIVILDGPLDGAAMSRCGVSLDALDSDVDFCWCADEVLLAVGHRVGCMVVDPNQERVGVVGVIGVDRIGNASTSSSTGTH